MSIHNENPTSSSTDDWGLEPLMDVAELASYLGIPISTVYDWRVHGKGPTAYRFGKHLKFAISDVRDWIAQQREPTSELRRPDRR
jgi:excisionase family DNA binding protein